MLPSDRDVNRLRNRNFVVTYGGIDITLEPAISFAGCIFAELLGRKPFFKGNSTKEQLEIIVAQASGVHSNSTPDARSYSFQFS